MPCKVVYFPNVPHSELADFLKDLLRSLRCEIIEERVLGDQVRLVAVNRKRMSMITAMLVGLLGGGALLRMRMGVEAIILREAGGARIQLTVRPYLNEMDIAYDRAGTADLERCRRLLDLLILRIQERFMGEGGGDTAKRPKTA